MTAPVLERRIGLGGSILLSFNGVLGGAIFALPAILAADFGNFSPWLFPLVALASLLIIVPFAKSAAAFPESGGPAAYGAVFGRFTGFELGWIYYIARTAAFAANANVLAAYCARWWPGADQGLARAAIILAVCVVLAAVNIAGTKRALRLLGGLTFLKAVPLLIAAIAAIALSFPLPAPGPLPEFSQLETGALLVFYAFVGFENGVVPAGETKRPETNLPRAILVTIGTTTLLYFLVQLAFIAALPGGGTDDKAPLIDLGHWLAGPVGAMILTLAAIASLGGNLHGIMTSTSRVTYALAARGDLPRWFASVHPRFVTPANSIAFLGVLAAALALIGTYRLAGRDQHTGAADRLCRDDRCPAAGSGPGEATALGSMMIGAAGIALCIWGASQATAEAWRTLGALALAGALLYAIARRATGSASSAATVSAIQPPPSSREPS